MTAVPSDDLIKARGPLGRLTLAYSYVMKGLVEKAKGPDFTTRDWAPLAELVAVDAFERVGSFREKVTWDPYVELLTMWAKATVWEFTVRRVTEGEGYAILELEERAKYRDRFETYRSVSVYEFDAAHRIQRLELYLSKAEAPTTARSYSWDWSEVSAEVV